MFQPRLPKIGGPHQQAQPARVWRELPALHPNCYSSVPAAGGLGMTPIASHRVSLSEAVRVWARIAALSFGGPAGQIAVMHRILVDEKRWIGERRFLYALNYCMLLPGPEAQQLAIYIGWLMHRTLGGVIAGGHCQANQVERILSRFCERE